MTRRVVVDSSVLIDHLRGHRPAARVLRAAVERGDEVWGVVITRAEVRAGMRPTELGATERLLDGIEWLEVDVQLADLAGDIAREYGRSHPGLQLADCLIAAGTAILDAELITTNVRHFPMFRELERPYP